MDKKKIVTLTSIALVMIVLITAKVYSKPNNQDSSSIDTAKSLKIQYSQLMKSGKPSMVIFSYDADC